MMKTCKRCQRRKAAGRFHKQSSAADGLAPWCKACKKEYRQKYYDENRDLEISQILHRRLEDGGVAYREYQQRYYESHCEKARAYSRIQYSKKSTSSKFREKNRKRVRQWHKENPEAAAEASSLRRSRQANAPVVERVYRKKVFARDNGQCHICEAEVAFEEMHLDHVIPLSKGGEHSYRNCKVACESCNLSKGNKITQLV